ncbi:MAG: homocitrate synthase NifV [Deferribacteres bacterium]|jgi:homocitrate synthase NifV|nr:pyruvate carboxyltransferase [Deferribacteraceae bacterium]MDK2792217.1 homocitrate synthase NifV [Deferribacteres bacterium]
MRKVFFDDTTLRDGEQTPGVIFRIKDKLKIVSVLEKLNVDEIEAGFPASGSYAMKSFEAIMNLNPQARIIAFNRCKIEDIEKSLSAGAKAVEISLPVSDIHIQKKLNKDRNWIIENLKRVITYCKEKDLYVSVGGEDSSRAEPSFLIRYFKTAQEYGADRVRFCDTVGILNPFNTFLMVSKIKKHLKIPVEFHGHNDLGMVTANTFAAVEAGADYVNTTILGLGERAGNCPLEELAMILFLTKKYHIDLILEHIIEVCNIVSEISGFKIEKNKPIVGENTFCHESGMHVDGILKNPQLYEPFDPEILKRERKITFGPTSGRANLIYLLGKSGVNFSKKDLPFSVVEKLKYDIV